MLIGKQGGAATVNGSATPAYSETQGDWTYYEHRITLSGPPPSNGTPQIGSVPVTLSGTGLIDELRLFPHGAMMTTYCFDELSRIISTTDVNGRSSHYQYDGLNRLDQVKDFNRDVRQKIEYKYYNQN